MSQCDRCGIERNLQTHHNQRDYCIYCKEHMELMDAYAKLQDRQGTLPYEMTDEDFASLERVRAMCHGGGAAVALAMENNGVNSLNLANMREMLQNGNKRLVKIIEHYGGYNRVVHLREQGKIDHEV